MTGGSTGSGTSFDYTTIKYNSAGDTLWVQRYNGPGNNDDAAFPIAVDGSGNVYVAGYSRSGTSGGTEDYATIKYSQSIGIQPISTEIPNSFELYQNYPNPFNPSTKIRFSIPLLRGVSALGGRGVLLKLYDALGREIITLVNEQLQPGTYETDWDASSYPSGIYFYTLSAENYTETKKMVLIK